LCDLHLCSALAALRRTRIARAVTIPDGRGGGGGGGLIAPPSARRRILAIRGQKQVHLATKLALILLIGALGGP
jgi:hypothetical protein